MPGVIKPSKNQQRRAKKKAEKAKVSRISSDQDSSRLILLQAKEESTPEQAPPVQPPEPKPTPAAPTTEKNGDLDPSIPDVMDESNPLFEMYKDIMDKFEQDDKEDPALKEPEKPEVYYDDDD